MDAETTEDLPMTDYYGPLLTQHVRTILESGLLLDEDYEVLLNASTFKIYPTKPNEFPYGLVAATLTAFTSVFLARRSGRLMIVLPPLAATVALLCLRRKATLRRRRHAQAVDNVVKSFIKLRKLNTSIIRYLKTRASAKQKDALLIYNENVHEFIVDLIEKNKTYFHWCLAQISFLANLTEELSDDYQGVKEINVESILTLDSSDSYELLSAKLQDVNTFLSSKYLNYLGITFCKNSRNINANNLEVVLNQKLPCTTANLDKLTACIQKNFNNLRYCTSKKLEIDTNNRNSFSKQVSGKLQQTLIGAINNLSIIIEKSQAVLGKIEEIDDDKDMKHLESALGNLRDHAYATYESLDVLRKLYGILSDSKKNQDNNEAKRFNKNLEGVDEAAAITVNYDDYSEALEENYELYIPDSQDLVHTVEPNECPDDQAGMHLSLMLKELRQSLKQHERFMAARNKRGIEDDSEESDLRKSSSKKVVVIPKFNLKADSLEQAKLPVPAPRTSKLPPPPPPPPPPSSLSFTLDNLSEEKSSLIENVKSLASQLGGREDVFGDDCPSDSD